MIRVPSPLDDETEKYVFEAMACGFAVHKAIGPGYGESIYKNAFCVELAARAIPFESERPFVIKYRDRPVGTHRLDLIVQGSCNCGTESRENVEARPRSSGAGVSESQPTPGGASDELRRCHSERGTSSVLFFKRICIVGHRAHRVIVFLLCCGL